MMNKWVKYLFLAVVLISLILIGIKACNIYDKYSELKGHYDALSGEYEKYRVSAIAETEDLRNIISQKDALIRKINAEVEEKYNEIEKLHGISEELQSAYTTLTNDVAKIVNLEAQVNTWKEKFSLAENIIADKDRVIFSLNEKYEAQLQITDRYKQLYENEATLRKLAEQRLKLADKKLRGLGFQLNLGKGVVIVLGAVILVGIVS